MKRKKKLLIGFFMCCMVLIGVISISQPVQAADSDFVIENGVLTKYNGSGGKVVIPNGVTKIGNGAFFGCSRLTEIVIPNGVTEIGSIAFSGCTSLTSITIPNSVTEIDGGAFSVCASLQEINVNSKNSFYASEDGILYNKNKTVLIIFPGGKTKLPAIPNSVTDIGECAFLGNTNLTNISIPNSVTKIGECAFAGCENLKEIAILNPKTKLEYNKYNNTSILEYGDGPTDFKNSVVSIKGYANSTAQELANNMNGKLYYDGRTTFQFIFLDGTGESDSNVTTKPNNPSKPNVTTKPDKTSSTKKTKALLKKIKVTKNLSIKRKKSKTIKVNLPKGLKKVTKYTNKSGQVKITYKSNKKKTATVNSKGKVTAKKKGTAKITTTVKLKDGTKKTFTTKVKVK